jgi:hypothetical protein
MTLEEMKQKLLKDEQAQHDITVTATFISLYKQLVKRGVLKKDDIDEINKNTIELVDNMNNKAAEEVLAAIEKDSLL